MDAAAGNGLAQAVFNQALGNRVNEGRWNQMDETYRTLKLLTLPGLESQALLREYKVDGALTALSLMHLLLEPYPISPFLVYAAFSPGPARGSYGDYKLAHLLQMIPDKTKRQQVKAVCAMERTHIIQPAVMHADIVGRLALGINFECTFFVTPRDEGQHISFKRRLLAELLLGCPEPWEQRQFLAFTEGFRLELSIQNNVAQAGLFSYKDKTTY